MNQFFSRMRILYGIQGTGNGHMSRARSLLPELRRFAYVDILISGGNHQNDPGEKPDYVYRGLSYTFGQSGGINFLDTALNVRPMKFLKDVYNLPVNKYDLIISDFEPLTAWAASITGIPSVAVSHQAAFLSPSTPRPNDYKILPEFIFSRFAPCDRYIGIHYEAYDSNIYTPLIRPSVRFAEISEEHHITVYHPAYSPEFIANIAYAVSDIKWHIFSPFVNTAKVIDNVEWSPVNPISFIDSIARCSGLITAAGFQTTAEAIHMGKRILTIPMKGQYEQLCNASALEKMGAMRLRSLSRDNIGDIYQWLAASAPQPRNYPEVADKIARSILSTGTNSAETSDIKVPRPA